MTWSEEWSGIIQEPVAQFGIYSKGKGKHPKGFKQSGMIRFIS